MSLTVARSEAPKKQTPSAPIPVPLLQIEPTTSGDSRDPGGSVRVSTKTKSFPDPLILKNSRPNGITCAPWVQIALRLGTVSAPSHPARDRPPAQSPDHEDRFADDRLGHFARPL